MGFISQLITGGHHPVLYHYREKTPLGDWEVDTATKKHQTWLEVVTLVLKRRCTSHLLPDPAFHRSDPLKKELGGFRSFVFVIYFVQTYFKIPTNIHIFRRVETTKWSVQNSIEMSQVKLVVLDSTL